jgi:Spy/CpxP family protein refolding chaperone
MFGGMGLVLGLLLALPGPGLGQSKETSETVYALQRERICKDLGLSEAKAKEFKAVEDKFAQARKEIVMGMRKNEDELEKLLIAPQPDEGKIKHLVAVITADHAKVFDSIRTQRQEEMALLTPIQQGKFLICLRIWHEEMRGKHGPKH